MTKVFHKGFVVLPAGTVVKIGGFPVALQSEITIYTNTPMPFEPAVVSSEQKPIWVDPPDYGELFDTYFGDGRD
jgi:hypothetical protein